MTRARKELVDFDTTPYYHCICRCVRRAFLCGEDHLTGKNYEHRKGWVLERLSTLQQVFAVDLCAYAIMSNHYHLVVRLNRDQAESWDEEEVMRRWEWLFSLPVLVARYRAGQCATQAERDTALSIIEEWRNRLADLSWFMRSLNEDLARRANAEDNCKGRFWEGRFKSQALLDEAAVLTCMSYVDLNPIRAGIADTPETSDFTSVKQRIGACKPNPRKSDSEEISGKPRLMALEPHQEDVVDRGLSFSTQDYLELMDWTGRAVRTDKTGAISSSLPPILARLGLDPDHYLRHIQRGGRAHHVAALGRIDKLRHAAERLGRCFLKGIGQSRQLYLREAQ